MSSIYILIYDLYIECCRLQTDRLNRISSEIIPNGGLRKKKKKKVKIHVRQRKVYTYQYRYMTNAYMFLTWLIMIFKWLSQFDLQSLSLFFLISTWIDTLEYATNLSVAIQTYDSTDLAANVTVQDAYIDILQWINSSFFKSWKSTSFIMSESYYLVHYVVSVLFFISHLFVFV